MAKDWGQIGGIASVAGVVVAFVALGWMAKQDFFGTFAPTIVYDIRGGRSCAGFLINNELPPDAKPTTLDEDQIKSLKEKIECYGDQIEKNPKDAIAFTNRGEAKRRLGRLKEALLDQEKALQLNPNLPEVQTGMSLVEGNLGNAKAANQAIQDALAQKESAITYFYQGIVFAEQKDWSSAETSFRKAIDLNPNFAEAYSNLGAILGTQGKTAEAISVHQKGISINPNDAKAYYNLGVTLGTQGKTAEAIAAFQKAITLNPNYAKAYHSLGVALMNQGNLEGSIARFKKARDLYRAQGNTQQANKFTQFLEKIGNR